LPWEVIPTDMFNKHREVFLVGKHLSDDASHMPVLSSLMW